MARSFRDSLGGERATADDGMRVWFHGERLHRTWGFVREQNVGELRWRIGRRFRIGQRLGLRNRNKLREWIRYWIVVGRQLRFAVGERRGLGVRQ
jgi:hypothetical protein